MTEDKKRNYFIEVNSQAECFSTFEDILNGLERAKIAYIRHDKDINEDGEIKQSHYHAVISYENARTFESVRKKFKGAHIEIAVNVSKCMRYLQHLDHKEKHQYDRAEISTNNDAWVNDNINSKPYPILTEREVFEGIHQLRLRQYNFGVLVYFYIKYGNDQVKPFRQMILDVWNSSETVEDFESIANEDLPF